MDASQGVPTGLTVRVQPKIEFVVQSLVDPCTDRSPCLHGSRCVSTSAPTSDVVGSVASSGLFYTMSCECLTSPIRFLGRTCGFAVIGCPGCISAYSGAASLTLLGVGLNAVNGIALAGLPVTSFSEAVTVNASSSSDVATAIQSLEAMRIIVLSIHVIRFVTPALIRSNQSAAAPSASSFQQQQRRLQLTSSHSSLQLASSPVVVSSSL